MGKRAVFAFKGITQLYNHENASNLSVRLKFSSLLFLGTQNLVNSCEKRHCDLWRTQPSRYSPGAARPCTVAPISTGTVLPLSCLL